MKSTLTTCMKLIKYSLFLFNLLFLICGLTFIVFGAIVNIQFKDYFDLSAEPSIGYLPLMLIVCGLLIAIIAFFGCCGGLKENRCMLITFACFLVVLFVLEIVFAFAGFALKESLYSYLQNQMFSSINSTKAEVMHTWNLVQTEFKCCGFNGASDWKLRSPNQLPNSCCKVATRCPTDTNPAYDVGCYSSILSWLNNNLIIILPVIIGVCVVQLIGTILSCLLSKSIKKGYELVKD